MPRQSKLDLLAKDIRKNRSNLSKEPTKWQQKPKKHQNVFAICKKDVILQSKAIEKLQNESSERILLLLFLLCMPMRSGKLRFVNEHKKAIQKPYHPASDRGGILF